MWRYSWVKGIGCCWWVNVFGWHGYIKLIHPLLIYRVYHMTSFAASCYLLTSVLVIKLCFHEWRYPILPRCLSLSGLSITILYKHTKKTLILLDLSWNPCGTVYFCHQQDQICSFLETIAKKTKMQTNLTMLSPMSICVFS